jgi:Na+:H+ antiporter, NhaA family
MSQRTLHEPRLTTSPTPLAERAFGPFERFAARETSGGIVLLAAAVLALAWSNSPWAASYAALWHTELVLGANGQLGRFTLHHVVNDGLMAVFFFVVGLEIKREILVGELASLKRASLPLAGALGGMLLPAALYWAINGAGVGASGWGIPMATDIAFAIGVLALLGNRVPPSLRVFLVALAIADDIGAVLVIAIFYSSGIGWAALGTAGALLALAMGANAAGVRRTAVYAIIGLALWLAVLYSGVHATVAGVLLAFAIPSRTRINEQEFLERSRDALRRFDDALADCAPGDPPTVLTNAASQEALHSLETLCEQAQPPLHRLEHLLHGVVAFGIMPLFAFANAGVTLQGDVGSALSSPITLGIILGLVVGKPVGITLFAWLGVRAGLAEQPSGVSWRALHFVAWLGGIGFTMSLFVADLAFTGPTAAPLLDAAKIGVFSASLIAGTIGYLLLRFAPVRAPASDPVDAREEEVNPEPGNATA